MNIVSITFLAFGLAMDAFAVAVTSGLAIKKLHINNALKIAVFFGSFQAVMPLIGWLAGNSFKDYISGIDHWIVFGLMSLIGSKMIYESMKAPSNEKKLNPLHFSVLLVLSIATSIDALAVGVSFSLINVFFVTPIIIIGMITFLLSFIGVYIGNKAGHFFENKIEMAGGFILIGIGIKILIEHMI